MMPLKKSLILRSPRSGRLEGCVPGLIPRFTRASPAAGAQRGESW